MVPPSPAAAPHGARAWWDRITRILPWTVDLAMVAGVGVFALFDLVAVGGTLDPLKPVAALGALLLVAIRRWAALPAFVLVALMVLGLAGMGHVVSSSAGSAPPLAPVVALAALATPVVRRQPVPVAVGAAAGGGVATLALSTWPLELVAQLVTAVLIGGAYVLGVGVGVYLRHLDDAQVRAADDARRAERLDLARELHDLVAHYVTGIVVQAQAAQVIADRDPSAAGAALVRIEGAGRDALLAMRGVVGSLRAVEDGAAPTAPPAGLVPLDGLAGLDDLAERSRAAGLPVTVTVGPGAAHAARGATATSTHRIVQESLTNVHRHAVAPTRVDVDVRLHGPHLVVTVTDDGRQLVGAADRTLGADRPLLGAGFGLVGMTERAQALAGTLTAGPVDPPGHGWRVQASLPVDPA